jgi:hypothetical protein
MTQAAILELTPVALLSAEAAYVREQLMASNPAATTTAEALARLGYAGQWYAFCLVLVVAFMAWRGWRMSVTDQFHRSFTMRTLLENNRKTHPSIAPILNWQQARNRSILDEDADKGPWMVARQPIQFAAEHGLLKDKNNMPIAKDMLLGEDKLADPYSPILSSPETVTFDREKAVELLRDQFGARSHEIFAGFHRMPKYLQKLGLSFLLYGTERKKEAYVLLDSMSLSYFPPQEERPGRWEKKKNFPYWRYAPAVKAAPQLMNLGFAWSKKEIDALLQGREAKRVLAPHLKYTHLVILALYEFARKKGVLPTADFIWLRPTNRSLFYLLNNFGRRTAWTEIAGPWAHYQAETCLAERDPALLKKLHALNCKWVDEGVNALEFAMYEEGWLSWENMSSRAKHGRSHQ